MTWRLVLWVLGLALPLQAQHFTGEVSYLLTYDVMRNYGDTLRSADTIRLAVGTNGIWQSYIHEPNQLLHLTDGVFVLDSPPSQGYWLQHHNQAMQAPRPVPAPFVTQLQKIKLDTISGIICTLYEGAEEMHRMSTSTKTRRMQRYWLADHLSISGAWQERVPGQPWWAWPATGKLVLRYEEWVWDELAFRYEAVKIQPIRNYRVNSDRFRNPLPFNQYQLDSLLVPIQLKVSNVRRPGFHRRD